MKDQISRGGNNLTSSALSFLETPAAFHTHLTLYLKPSIDNMIFRGSIVLRRPYASLESLKIAGQINNPPRRAPSSRGCQSPIHLHLILCIRSFSFNRLQAFRMSPASFPSCCSYFGSSLQLCLHDIVTSHNFRFTWHNRF